MSACIRTLPVLIFRHGGGYTRSLDMAHLVLFGLGA